MRPTRTLPAALAALAALLSGCLEEELDTGSEPLVEEVADTGLGLAADGDPPAWEGEDSLPPWEGEGDPPWAGEEPGEPEKAISPTRPRIELTISATGDLKPDAGVKLTIKGVVKEPIDSGEVVLTLPTRTLMDHVGEDREDLPDLPAKKRWDLPPMSPGGTWSGSYTVPGEAAGYYRMMANAYTHGPDGMYILDDVGGSAWMYVHETDGQLTRWFEDSLFPDSVHPRAGPLAGGGAMSSRPDSNSTNWHPDSVFLAVVYTISEGDGFKRAVGARIRAEWDVWLPGQDRPSGFETRSVRVPEDGIVSFGCRVAGRGGGFGHLRLTGDAPDTRWVQGREDIVFWSTGASDCGQLVQVEVLAHRYLPWRVLNLSADTLTKHFGHYRGRINWKIHSIFGKKSYYNPAADKITLAWRPPSDEEHFHYVAAHEYGHALHHHALGGMWWLRQVLHGWGCFNHSPQNLESHRCALQEGFANYAGVVGSGGFREQCYEYLGTRRAGRVFGGEDWCWKIPHDQKPRSEAWIAALFMDLIDGKGGSKDPDDNTEYPGRYVAEVFKTCKTKSRYWSGWIPFVGNIYIYIWWKRTNVSNIVWCLERDITPVYHEEDSVFGDIGRPWDVEEKATEPPDWNQADIRSTWRKNLN